MGKLSYFLKPESIAVIGASAMEGKVGHSVMNNIMHSGFKGQLYPINPRPDPILGLQSYKSVMDVPGPIDIAVMCIPSKLVVASAEECGKKGVRGIICITAGFREIGGDGEKYEHDLKEVCAKYGVRVLGPNVLGIITPALNCSFAARHPIPGRIGILSQSGAMLTAILDWAETNRIGFSNFVSLGNKADVDEVDFIMEMADDPQTKIIILYLESVEDGEKFMRVVPECTRRKPVVILKSGTSVAGKAAASSHTGALAGDDIAFDLAFAKAGVIRAHSMNELFDLATLFDKMTSPPVGQNFAIVTNAGGPGILATDAFENAGIGFTRFSPEIAKALRAILPDEASIKNPVDIVGDAPPKRYQDTLETAFREPVETCAGALVLVTPQAQTKPTEVARVMVEMKARHPDRVLVGTFMGGASMVEPRRILEEAHIPCYAFPEPAISSMRDMLKWRDLTAKPARLTTPPLDIDSARVEAIFAAARADKRAILMPAEASEIFTMLGISNPRTKLAMSEAEAGEMADEIGYPVVMKIVSPQIVHKSDCGGVKLRIKCAAEARAAYVEIMKNAAERGPKDAVLVGCEVQQMIDFTTYAKTTEIILGVNRDPLWGPMVMVGQGGVYANYFKDVAFELALGYDEEIAAAQVRRTKVSQILEGVRGEPRSDIEGVVSCMVKLAKLVERFPAIRELDMNPILVFESRSDKPGYSAIDIKIMID